MARTLDQFEQRIINRDLTATDVGRRDVSATTPTFQRGPKGGYESKLEVAAAPGAGGAWTLRLRDGQVPPTNEAIWIESDQGGIAGPFTPAP